VAAAQPLAGKTACPTTCFYIFSRFLSTVETPVFAEWRLGFFTARIQTKTAAHAPRGLLSIPHVFGDRFPSECDPLVPVHFGSRTTASPLWFPTPS
jgi:hypothetical protein